MSKATAMLADGQAREKKVTEKMSTTTEDRKEQRK
jgi:hypothetical protein